MQYKIPYILCLMLLACNSMKQEPSFAIVDTKQINQIHIFSKNKTTQVLRAKGERWYLNDSIKVRPDAIENIFRILPKLKIKSYPPKAAWENMVTAMRNDGVELVFKNDEGQNIKHLLLGGTTNDERGTYAMNIGDSKPYIIHIPGFEGNLATRFLMDEVEWRDRMILDDEIKSCIKLTMTYPGDPFSSFELKKQGDGWILKNTASLQLSANASLIKSYVEGFIKLPSESIENRFLYKDSVLRMTPHSILELSFENFPPKTVKFYSNTLEGDADVERMFVFDGKDFYLAQLRILQKIFRPLNYFTAHEAGHSH